MRILLLALLVNISYIATAQELLVEENDTTVLTEYNDGRLWAYKQIDDFIVGMTNFVDKDGYGKNYQIIIFIKNLGNTSVTFDPSLVTSSLVNKHDETEEMKVYSYERYMKKVKRQQAWTAALTGFSNGVNTGMASYQTTYTTTYGVGRIPYTQVQTTYNPAAASMANMVASTQMMTLSKMMADDKKTISQGYMKMNTIHPEEGILGYMNIEFAKGKRMTVNIPINEQVFSFVWDITKKRK